MHYKKPSRKVTKTFIHCSDSDHAHHDHIDIIREWHVGGNGWSDVGYHFFISKKHGLQFGRDLERTPAAQYPHNKNTVAICLSGREHFTEKQFNWLRRICIEIDNAHDSMSFHGHREVSAKTCPNFDYKGVLGLTAQGKLTTSAPVLINTRKESIYEKFLKWLERA
jgi:hypothetical protein